MRGRLRWVSFRRGYSGAHCRVVAQLLGFAHGDARLRQLAVHPVPVGPRAGARAGALVRGRIVDALAADGACRVARAPAALKLASAEICMRVVAAGRPAGAHRLGRTRLVAPNVARRPHHRATRLVDNLPTRAGARTAMTALAAAVVDDVQAVAVALSVLGAKAIVMRRVAHGGWRQGRDTGVSRRPARATRAARRRAGAAARAARPPAVITAVIALAAIVGRVGARIAVVTGVGCAASGTVVAGLDARAPRRRPGRRRSSSAGAVVRGHRGIAL